MSDARPSSTMDWSENCESTEDVGGTDEVVGEMDVFISKGHSGSLYLLQYPLRPSSQSLTLGMEQRNEIKCDFKPKQEKLQIKLPLDPSCSSYDKSRGEQIAINCGASTSSKGKAAPFEKTMDYQQFVSMNASGFHNNCYAVAYLKNGQLHLTPFKNVLQMKPSFGYLDAADAASAKNASAAAQADAGGDSSQDDSETEAGTSSGPQLQTVRVKFKEESEWLRKRREASYQYQQKIKDEEPWVPLKFVSEKNDEIAQQRTLLLGNAIWSNPSQLPDDVVMKDADSVPSQSTAAVFDNDAARLIRLIAPKAAEQKITQPRLPSTVISLNQLRSLPLPDQVRTLLTNVKVLRFAQSLSLLPPKTDAASVLKYLQSYAQLVKGCWVVRSDILYPKGSFSPRTGASADLLCRARDYAMYKFAQTNTHMLTKREIANAVKIPSEDVDDILTQLAKFKVQSGWHFMYPPDTEFMQSYPEIAQQQAAKWEAKFKELSQHLNLNRQRHLSSSGASDRRSVSPASAARRRRTESGRNSTSDHETRLMSPPPAVAGSRNRRRSSSGKSRARTVSTNSTTAALGAYNGTVESSPSSAMTKLDLVAISELKNFLYDAFCTKPVLSLARLVLQLRVKVSESPKDHPLAKCMEQRIIEECVMHLGVTMFDKGYGEKAERTYYVYGGGSWPELRQFLIKFLHDKSQGKKEKAAFRFNAFKQACTANLTSDYLMPNDSEMKQLILEYCVAKPGGYYALQDS